MNENDVLTTGDIAKFCNVHFMTVIRWIDRGQLKAHKLPGRGDNRVVVRDFLEFLRNNNLPIPAELAGLNKKVLVVDDDEAMANAIARTLVNAGYEVEIALDGFKAGSKLELFHPYVMTLDLRMPGLSGLEVLQYIKSRPEFQAIKILIISASLKKDIQAALDAGADDFLQKPFDNDELVGKIAALTGAPAQV